MVANTGDKKIGPSCAKDEENLQKELTAVAGSVGITYKPYILNAASEKDFNKTKLMAMLNAVKTEPDDIILFSYSGHGARWDNQKDDYPFMELWVTTPFNPEPKNNTEYEMIKRIVKENSVSLSEVYELLNKKGARLNIVLGDMCNTDVGAPRPVSLENILSFGDALRSGTEIIRRDPVKLRKLFIEASGNLISNASKPKEKASGNNTAGGYYTASFVEALRQAGSYNQPSASWEKIIAQTIDQALIYRKNASPEEVQNGIRYVQIKE
ncbi:MAG: caspase family protein [Bacteroidota bacterium]